METLLHCWWECKSIQPLWRTEGRFLKKPGLKLPYDLIIPLLSIYPKETIIERHMSPLFIVALFTIAGTWKQPRWPFTNEWIKKLWYIYTMKHYSVMKRNEFDSVLVRWMNLEPITQSEVNKKDKYHILTYIYEIYKGGADEPICRAAIETHTYRTDLWTRQGGEERVGQIERAALKRTHCHM